ncbi:MAG: hypothetical protein CMJ81_20025 [Planctomycetaceae bacterium]|nr:hypothetical protein [Planctomycetaceae bacterium]MBP63241.1 hypothetical protein [Planctomycetaceae bacterium]
MAKRAKTSSFVTEVELNPTGRQAKKMRSRFEAAHQVYDACLGETLRRMDLVRQSPKWRPQFLQYSPCWRTG